MTTIMSMSHEGVVMHVSEFDVVVVYSADGEYIEHTYPKSQFIDGQVPCEGDNVTVCVQMGKGESVETKFQWVMLHGTPESWTVAYRYDDGTFAVVGSDEKYDEKVFDKIKWGPVIKKPRVR